MKLPQTLQDVVDSFESLPGVGPKTAQRLAFYLLRIPRDDINKFAESLVNLKQNTNICKKCFNVGDEEFCSICNDNSRDKNTICVVESPLDVIAIEKSDYKGVYHVLHGVINPIAGIGPDEIFSGQLINRVGEIVKENVDTSLIDSVKLESEYGSAFRDSFNSDSIASESNVSDIKEIPSNIEIILATSTSLEGETTSMYLHKELTKSYGRLIRISRIGKGLPIGAEIEYSDERTITDALEARTQY